MASLLVIDDDPLVGSTVSHILSTEHRVRWVTSGRVALEGIGAGVRFGLILCDLLMPDMTGEEFWEQLRRMDPSQAERVVFMTGGSFRGHLGHFLASVPNSCLEKPFEMEALWAMVREQLRRSGGDPPSDGADGKPPR